MGARELEPEGGLLSDQPAFQATADRPTNQEEARKPSGCQSSPSHRAVEMRALVFRESLRYHQTSCVLFVLSSHYPSLIGDRRYASSRDRRYTRFSAITAAATAAVPEAVVRTWVVLLGLAYTQYLSNNRAVVIVIENRRYVDRRQVTSVLRFADCLYLLRRRRSLYFNFSESREIMAPDSCDWASRRSSEEKKRLRGISGTATSN